MSGNESLKKADGLSASPDIAGLRACVIGAGLVGRSWAIVFARAGMETSLYDPVITTGRAALEQIRHSLIELAAHRLVDDADAAFARIRFNGNMAEATSGADWIQECAPENLESKIGLFAKLDELARPEATIASSTSGLRASAFTNGLKGRSRTLVAHPVNPPHLAPLVEIAPAPWTAPEVARRAFSLMEQVGQKPIMVRKEIDGFILNRIQGTVLDEAFKLVEEGYVSVEDLDRVMIYGLAPRWSFMGPFETIDLNAPGGVRDYADRYGSMYHGFARNRSSDASPWAGSAVAAVEADRRRKLPIEKIDERSAWRDHLLMKLAARRHLSGKGKGEAQ